MRSVGFDLLDFAAPDLVNRLVELAHNVEAIKDVERLRSFFDDDLEICGPHVATDKLELGAALRAKLSKKSQQRLGLAFRTAPEQPSGSGVNLINQSQILVPLENGHLINADLGDALKTSVREAVIDNELNGLKNLQLGSKILAVSC